MRREKRGFSLKKKSFYSETKNLTMIEIIKSKIPILQTREVLDLTILFRENPDMSPKQRS